MALITVLQLKEQLNWTDGLGSADDALMQRKIDAAQDHIERLLGFKIDAQYPPAGEPPVSTAPASLVEAVAMLAAYWYEQREAALVGVTGAVIPLGVEEIVREYREFSFDG